MDNGEKKNFIRRLWAFLKSIPDRYGRICPPGYEYKPELNSNGILFGLGWGMSFQFLFRLKDAYDDLYEWLRISELGQYELVYQIRYGAVAASFAELTQDYWWWFLPWLISLMVYVVVHYLYYYRGTKSIYVMRRLRNPYVVFKSCVQASVVQLVLGLLVALSVYLFDYGLYMWVMPGECNPRFW